MSEIVNGITINSAQIKELQQLVEKKSKQLWLPRLTHWHTDRSVSLGCRHKTRIVFTLGFAAIWVWWFLLTVIWCCLMCRTIMKAWPFWYSRWMQKSVGAKLKLQTTVLITAFSWFDINSLKDTAHGRVQWIHCNNLLKIYHAISVRQKCSSLRILRLVIFLEGRQYLQLAFTLKMKIRKGK